jgi:hypothetical protein
VVSPISTHGHKRNYKFCPAWEDINCFYYRFHHRLHHSYLIITEK